MNPFLDGSADLENVVLPLPYRIFALFGLGILGWASNLHILDALDVDAVQALDLRVEDNGPVRLPVTQREYLGSSRTYALIKTTYQVFLGYTALCTVSWILYRLRTNGDPLLVDSYGHIPAITACLLIFIVVCPYGYFFKAEREKFINAIRRCLFSSATTPILFSDVIFADIGTSYSKVFGDIWLSLCMLLPGNTLLHSPSPDGLARWILPAIMSLPSFVRLRQCLIEYNLPSNESRRPFFNAIKYATAFPVIFLSAAQRIVVVDITKQKGEQAAAQPWHGEHQLFRLWLLAVFVNSVYSFWWDVTNDWGFDLLKPDSAPQRVPPKRLLLPRMHYGTPLITRQSTDVSPTDADFSSNSHQKSSNSISMNGVVPHQHHKSLSSSHSQHRNHPYGLRTMLLYPLPVYPLVIFLNLVLRMSWSVRLSSQLNSMRDGSVAMFWLELAEIARRWLWVFIRVEWEVVKRMQSTPLVERVVRAGVDDEEEVVYEAVERPVLPDA